MKKSLPIKTVFYTDELNDEFSSAIITPKKIDENYNYLGGRFFKFIRFILYRLVAMPIGFCYNKIALKHSVKNRKVLKECKHEGYFLYANHTQQIGDAFIPTMACFPKQAYIIVHPNNVSIKGLGNSTHYLGALPLPSTLKATRNFLNAIEKRILENACVVIYPEAHIWPYYTKIRNFSSTSFKYPINYNTPAYSMTTTYQKRKFSTKPKVVSYIDGPFYAKNSLPIKEREEDLRNQIYNKMVERSKLSMVDYIEYKEKND